METATVFGMTVAFIISAIGFVAFPIMTAILVGWGVSSFIEATLSGNKNEQSS